MLLTDRDGPFDEGIGMTLDLMTYEQAQAAHHAYRQK
jgi:hypothetical protein